MSVCARACVRFRVCVLRVRACVCTCAGVSGRCAYANEIFDCHIQACACVTNMSEQGESYLLITMDLSMPRMTCRACVCVCVCVRVRAHVCV